MNELDDKQEAKPMTLMCQTLQYGQAITGNGKGAFARVQAIAPVAIKG